MRGTLPAVIMTLLVGCGPAYALDEQISVLSSTLTDEAILSGDARGGVAVTLTGRLSGPDGSGRRPVVILLHGTDGPKSGAAGSWRYNLNLMGVTTLRLDSYTGRGLTQASTKQGSFGQFLQIYDAYRAADALAADPRVDGSHIAVMGFSRGGTAALYGAMNRFLTAFGPKQARIVAFIPFYPACNFQLDHELDVAAVPVREFHGAADDWAPAAPCRAYISRLKMTGADAEMTEYPAALHAFDSASNPAFFTDPAFQTSRNCLRREERGQLINAATGEPFSYDDACVEYGPTMQYNDAAATAARKAVKAVLDTVFAGP